MTQPLQAGGQSRRRMTRPAMRRLASHASAVLALAIGILAAGGSTPVQAHELKTDGTIGAVLHLDPDDNPTTGSPVPFLLAFEDTTNRFTMADCTCTAVIQENDDTIYSQPLQATGEYGSENTVTFPHPDIYTLQVSGQPKHDGDFQPFLISYTLRVQAGNAPPAMQPFPPLLWIGLVLTTGLLLLGVYQYAHNETYIT